MTLRVGSLCTGYAGIEMALEHVFDDVELVFVAESDPDAAKILEYHFPETVNLGDIKVVNWGGDAIPKPVDILTAGFP